MNAQLEKPARRKKSSKLQKKNLQFDEQNFEKKEFNSINLSQKRLTPVFEADVKQSALYINEDSLSLPKTLQVEATRKELDADNVKSNLPRVKFTKNRELITSSNNEKSLKPLSPLKSSLSTVRKESGTHSTNHYSPKPNYITEVIRKSLYENEETFSSRKSSPPSNIRRPSESDSTKVKRLPGRNYITDVIRKALYENDETENFTSISSFPKESSIENVNHDISQPVHLTNFKRRSLLDNDGTFLEPKFSPAFNTQKKSDTESVAFVAEGPPIVPTSTAPSLSDIEGPEKVSNDIPASHFLSSKVRRASNDNKGPRMLPTDSKIGWSLEEQKKPLYPLLSIGFKELSALPPYPIQGSALVQPPYPTELSNQPTYPVEKTIEPPYPVEKSIQPHYPTENSVPSYQGQPSYYTGVVTTPYPVPVAQNIQRSNAIVQPPYPVLEPPYPVDKSVELPYPTEISQLHPVKAVAAHPRKHIGLEAILQPEHEERIIQNKYIAEEAKLLERFSQSHRSSTRKPERPRIFGPTPILVECPHCFKWVETRVRNKIDGMSQMRRFFHFLIFSTSGINLKHYCSNCDEFLGRQDDPCRIAVGDCKYKR